MFNPVYNVNHGVNRQNLELRTSNLVQCDNRQASESVENMVFTINGQRYTLKPIDKNDNRNEQISLRASINTNKNNIESTNQNKTNDKNQNLVLNSNSNFTADNSNRNMKNINNSQTVDTTNIISKQSIRSNPIPIVKNETNNKNIQTNSVENTNIKIQQSLSSKRIDIVNKGANNQNSTTNLAEKVPIREVNNKPSKIPEPVYVQNIVLRRTHYESEDDDYNSDYESFISTNNRNIPPKPVETMPIIEVKINRNPNKDSDSVNNRNVENVQKYQNKANITALNLDNDDDDDHFNIKNKQSITSNRTAIINNVINNQNITTNKVPISEVNNGPKKNFDPVYEQNIKFNNKHELNANENNKSHQHQNDDDDDYDSCNCAACRASNKTNIVPSTIDMRSDDSNLADEQIIPTKSVNKTNYELNSSPEPIEKISNKTIKIVETRQNKASSSVEQSRSSKSLDIGKSKTSNTENQRKESINKDKKNTSEQETDDINSNYQIIMLKPDSIINFADDEDIIVLRRKNKKSFNSNDLINAINKIDKINKNINEKNNTSIDKRNQNQSKASKPVRKKFRKFKNYKKNLLNRKKISGSEKVKLERINQSEKSKISKDEHKNRPVKTMENVNRKEKIVLHSVNKEDQDSVLKPADMINNKSYEKYFDSANKKQINNDSVANIVNDQSHNKIYEKHYFTLKPNDKKAENNQHITEIDTNNKIDNSRDQNKTSDNDKLKTSNYEQGLKNNANNQIRNNDEIIVLSPFENMSDSYDESNDSDFIDQNKKSIISGINKHDKTVEVKQNIEKNDIVKPGKSRLQQLLSSDEDILNKKRTSFNYQNIPIVYGQNRTSEPVKDNNEKSSLPNPIDRIKDKNSQIIQNKGSNHSVNGQNGQNKTSEPVKANNQKSSLPSEIIQSIASNQSINNTNNNNGQTVLLKTADNMNNNNIFGTDNILASNPINIIDNNSYSGDRQILIPIQYTNPANNQKILAFLPFNPNIINTATAAQIQEPKNVATSNMSTD